MHQENLFAAPTRPVRLTISIERLWAEGEDVWEITRTATGSKGTGVMWSTTEVHKCARAGTIVSEIAAATVLRFDSTLWDREPTAMSTDAWEHHLFS